MRDGISVQIIFDFSSGGGEQRPDKGIQPGFNAAQSLKSRSPQQMHEQGLGIVVGVVGGGDAVGLQLPGQLIEKGVPQSPGGFLQPHL